MSLRADWERRASARAEEHRADLGHQAGNAFLTYISAESARPERLAAVATAASQLGWALAAAEVECEGVDITPLWLRDAGRDLIVRGEHMSRILTSPDRPIRLLRQSSWSWIAGDADPETWVAQSTETGPHATTTRNLPWEAVVRFDWASDATSPYVGRPATDTARDTASLASNVELSLSRESGGDLAKIVAMPLGAEGADSTDALDNDASQSDPMEDLRRDLGAARGRTLLTESTANAHDLGGRPPQDDWKPRRLGPDMPPSEVTLAADAHARMLNVLCLPVALTDASDGTSQRESLRRWHMGLVVPVAKAIAHELATKLERPCRLKFDPYPLDMQTRVGQLVKIVEKVEGVTFEQAAKIVGVDIS